LVNILTNTFFGTSGVLPQAPTSPGQMISNTMSGGSGMVNNGMSGGNGMINNTMSGSNPNLSPSNPNNLGGYQYGSVPGNFDATLRLNQ